MIGLKSNVSAVALVMALALPVGARAQSTGPSHEGYDPNAPVAGHFHEGELGDKLLIVERSLKCGCGTCAMDVHTCQFQMQCGTSPVWSERIRASLEAGEGVDAIQAAFVSQYGPTVLMLPPAKGFNLVGYLLPAFAIVMAGMLVGLIARGHSLQTAVVPVGEVSDEQTKRLEAALRKLDESEGPDW